MAMKLSVLTTYIITFGWAILTTVKEYDVLKESSEKN